MQRTVLAWLSLLILTCLPSLSLAQNPEPAVVIQMQPIEELLANARVIGTALGFEEQVKQFEGLIKARTGPKGLDGLDTKRPLAIYASIGPAGVDSSAVMLIPIAEEEAFLTLLGNANVKIEKGKDGIHSVGVDAVPVPVYLRFAHKHAYVSVQSREALEMKNLMVPEAVIGTAVPGIVSMTVRLDRIPENLREMAIDQVKQANATARNQQQDNETKAARDFRLAGLDASEAQSIAVLREGRQQSLRLDLNRKTGELVLETSLDAKANTGLAKDLAQLGKAKSATAGILRKGSPGAVAFHMALPEQAKKALEAVVREGMTKAMEEEKDPKKRAGIKSFFDGILPTVAAGEFDMALDVRGPSKSGHLTVVAALKIQQSGTMDTALRSLIKEIPEAERKALTVDAEKAGAIAIHRINTTEADAAFHQAMGKDPLYFALAQNALFLAVGEGSLNAIKDAVKTGATAASPMRARVALGTLVPILAANQPAATVAKGVFQKPNEDVIEITVEGGQAAKIRATMKLPILRFLMGLGGGAL